MSMTEAKEKETTQAVCQWIINTDTAKSLGILEWLNSSEAKQLGHEKLTDNWDGTWYQLEFPQIEALVLWRMLEEPAEHRNNLARAIMENDDDLLTETIHEMEGLLVLTHMGQDG